jgi:pRiA4b ORF-3-like protein
MRPVKFVGVERDVGCRGCGAIDTGGSTDDEHADTGRLIEELRRYAPLAAGRPIPPVYQLKISLMHVRPSVWRRVKVSADTPLGGLRLVIQAAMGWDGDHLHQFTVNRRNFSDPAYELDAMDEWRVDLVDVLPRSGLTASYLYDFGDSWRHTVEVEKIHDAEADLTYPCCVAVGLVKWSGPTGRQADSSDRRNAWTDGGRA